MLTIWIDNRSGSLIDSPFKVSVTSVCHPKTISCSTAFCALGAWYLRLGEVCSDTNLL
jgi:hypothetical protein